MIVPISKSNKLQVKVLAYGIKSFDLYPNSQYWEELKNKLMKVLTDEAADDLKGGTSASSCGYQIVSSAVVGGLFGGAGAIIGAVAAATGPGCLALW